MLTQTGKNTHVVGITGNFDVAQTNVKKLFNDKELAKTIAKAGYQFSSANSINIGRLFPQIVYYFYAYGKLVKDGKISVGDKINFSVPTGNFGDILAGWFAKKLGLPVNKLICASNKNNILTDFFNEGTYDKNRPFYVTSSPSMDILVSSNLLQKFRASYLQTRRQSIRIRPLHPKLPKAIRQIRAMTARLSLFQRQARINSRKQF